MSRNQWVQGPAYHDVSFIVVDDVGSLSRSDLPWVQHNGRFGADRFLRQHSSSVGHRDGKVCQLAVSCFCLSFSHSVCVCSSSCSFTHTHSPSLPHPSSPTCLSLLSHLHLHFTHSLAFNLTDSNHTDLTMQHYFLIHLHLQAKVHPDWSQRWNIELPLQLRQFIDSHSVHGSDGQALGLENRAGHCNIKGTWRWSAGCDLRLYWTEPGHCISWWYDI